MMIPRIAVLLVGLATATAINAEDRLFLTGGEYSDAAYYTYAGVILPGPGRENGRGWLQRYWVDGFGYEYDGGPGRVEATAYGAEAALGYGNSSAEGWWAVWLGLRYTDTDLSPDDPSAQARGSQLGGKLQVEGEQALAPDWRASAIASYANEQNGYWGRIRLMHGSTPGRAFGVEVVANGNDEADSMATGLVVSLGPDASKWSVGLRAGYRFQDDADGAYGGVEFGYGF